MGDAIFQKWQRGVNTLKLVVKSLRIRKARGKKDRKTRLSRKKRVVRGAAHGLLRLRESPAVLSDAWHPGRAQGECSGRGDTAQPVCRDFESTRHTLSRLHPDRARSGVPARPTPWGDAGLGGEVRCPEPPTWGFPAPPPARGPRLLSRDRRAPGHAASDAAACRGPRETRGERHATYVPAFNVLRGPQAAEAAVDHDGESRAQGLALLHAGERRGTRECARLRRDSNPTAPTKPQRAGPERAGRSPAQTPARPGEHFQTLRPGPVTVTGNTQHFRAPRRTAANTQLQTHCIFIMIKT